MTYLCISVRRHSLIGPHGWFPRPPDPLFLYQPIYKLIFDIRLFRFSDIHKFILLWIFDIARNERKLFIMDFISIFGIEGLKCMIGLVPLLPVSLLTYG